MFKFNRKSLIVAGAIAATAAIGGGSAFALTASASQPPITQPAGNTVWWCVSNTDSSHNYAVGARNTAHTCSPGYTLWAWAKQGVPGTPGKDGAPGKDGTPGTPGTPGASAVTNVTAATQLSDWPDTGGAGDVWALDNFTRTINVTVENQVNNSHCGGAPACYAVFGTITDDGTSAPQDGAAAPNNSLKGTITAANITQVTTTGTASFQFYATSAAINAKNVPATASGSAKPASTTAWGELAFPSGTQFFGDTLTAYDWHYSASVSYTAGGTSVSCNQSFNDAINPGDDGQGASDGNITGTCAS